MWLPRQSLRCLAVGLILSATAGCGDLGLMDGGDTGGMASDVAASARASAQAPPSLSPGDSFTFDNPAVTWQVVAVDGDGRIAWSADNGETQITAPNPLLPALEWHSPDRGSGKRLISNESGPMFPMEPGRTVRFRSTVDTDQPPYAWEFDWTCAIGDLESVTVPAGTFPSYPVSCGRQVEDELVFYYAPEVGNYVRMIVADSNGGPPTVRRLIAYRRGAGAQPMPMAEAMPDKPDVVMEADAADGSMPPPVENSAEGNSAGGSQGPTALGMIAGLNQGQSAAPSSAPQSELIAGAQSPDASGTPAVGAGQSGGTQQASLPAGTVAVHLASYKNPNNAETGWNQLMAGNRDQLNGTRPIIRRVDLGSKGVFYRLHAGPLASEDQAQAVCRTLKQRGVYCAVATLQ